MVGSDGKKLGDFFDSRREKGIEGLLTISVTLNRGLVPRDSLERKTDTNLSPQEHLLVRKGDVAYNMMRMWQGASGRANQDAIVSPAYVVLAPRPNIDSLYAAYLFKTPRMIYLFWAYSHGLTKDRLRLYFKDFSLIPITLPPVKEQRHIAKILANWADTIHTVKKLIANSQVEKNAFAQLLLTGEQRLPGFDDEWMNASLADIFAFKKGTGLSKGETNGIGNKCVLYGELFTRYGEIIHDVKSRTESQGGLPSISGDILIPASTTTTAIDLANATAIFEDDVLLGGDINVLRPDEKRVSSKFFAYYLTHAKKHEIASKAQGITIIHLYGSHLKKIIVQLPSVREQEAIADVLYEADKIIHQLQKYLFYLEQENKSLMQQLLTGKRRVKVEAA